MSFNSLLVENYIFYFVVCSLPYIIGFTVGYFLDRTEISKRGNKISIMVFLTILIFLCVESVRLYRGGECNEWCENGCDEYDNGLVSVLYTRLIVLTSSYFFGFVTRYLIKCVKFKSKNVAKFVILCGFFLSPLLFVATYEGYGKIFWVRQLCEDWSQPGNRP